MSIYRFILIALCMYLSACHNSNDKPESVDLFPFKFRLHGNFNELRADLMKKGINVEHDNSSMESVNGGDMFYFFCDTNNLMYSIYVSVFNDRIEGINAIIDTGKSMASQMISKVQQQVFPSIDLSIKKFGDVEMRRSLDTGTAPTRKWCDYEIKIRTEYFKSKMDKYDD